jgi:hypothetical protein
VNRRTVTTILAKVTLAGMLAEQHRTMAEPDPAKAGCNFAAFGLFLVPRGCQVDDCSLIGQER